MIICDRKELISQAADHLNELGLFPTIIAPGYKMTKNVCYLASVDTLIRRELPAVDVIIIDEAHKQTFDKIIRAYQNTTNYNPKIIGATATPVRSGNQTSMHLLYQTIIEPTSISKLLEEGFLKPCIMYAAKQDFSDIKMTGGDYNNKALYERMNKSRLYAGVIQNYKRFAEGKKTLVFNVNVEHSKKMVQEFRANGYIAEHLDGKTPAFKRRQILKEFKTGKIQVLSNCSVLTTGYDEPSIECVILNRATKSLPLYLQMVGRGSRSFEGKNSFICIDMGSNVYEHGLWEQERTWNLHKKKKNSSGVAPVKLCKLCEAMNHASARVCFECEKPFDIKEKKLLEAEFIRVNKNRGAKISFNPMKATRRELENYAKEKNYSPKWVNIQLDLQRKKSLT